MMEQGYANAFAWARGHGNARMLEQLIVGLENHRRWMREGR